MSVAALIQELLMQLGYAEHLQKTQPDWESRWENVRELITFATESTSQVSSEPATSASETPSEVDAETNVESTKTEIESFEQLESAGVSGVSGDEHFDDADSSPEDELAEELET